jgi:hypothetical protein
MRYLLLAVAALLAGFGLGRWTPTQELRRREAAWIEERNALQRRSASPSTSIAREFLRLPAPVAPPTETLPPVPSPAPTSTTPAAQESGPQEPPSDFRSGMERARELWITRSGLARNSFLANIGATPDEMLRFDETIQAMNEQLAGKITDWAEVVKENGSVTAEDGVRLMHELSGVVAGSYDELDQRLRPGWREKAGLDFQLFDFVDPSVGESLVSVEGALRHRPWRGRR